MQTHRALERQPAGSPLSQVSPQLSADLELSPDLDSAVRTVQDWLLGQMDQLDRGRSPLQALLRRIQTGSRGSLAAAAWRAEMPEQQFRDELAGDLHHQGWGLLMEPGTRLGDQVGALIGALRVRVPDPGGGVGAVPDWEQMVRVLLELDQAVPMGGPGRPDEVLSIFLPKAVASLLDIRFRAGSYSFSTPAPRATVILPSGPGGYLGHERTFGAIGIESELLRASSAAAPPARAPSGTSRPTVDRSGWVMAPLPDYESSGIAGLLAHLLMSAVVQGHTGVAARLGLVSGASLEPAVRWLRDGLLTSAEAADAAAGAAVADGRVPETPLRAMLALVARSGLVADPIARVIAQHNLHYLPFHLENEVPWRAIADDPGIGPEIAVFLDRFGLAIGAAPRAYPTWRELAEALDGQPPGRLLYALAAGLLDLGMDVVVVGPGEADEFEVSALVPPPAAGQPARVLVYLGWDGAGYHVYGPAHEMRHFQARLELSDAQYLELVDAGLRPDPEIARDGDALFASVIAVAGVPYLAGVLAERDPETRNRPVDIGALRQFLADRFAEDYASEPERFDPFLAGATAQDVWNRLRDDQGWDAVLAAVAPRLVADHLRLRVSVLNGQGLSEHDDDAAKLRLASVGQSGWLVALKPGVPPRQVVRGRPVIEPGPVSAGFRSALDRAADAAERVAQDLARAEAVGDDTIMRRADKQAEAAYARVLEMARAGDDPARLAEYRVMAELLTTAWEGPPSRAEQAERELRAAAELVLSRPWVLGGTVDRAKIDRAISTAGKLAWAQAIIGATGSADARARRSEAAAAAPGMSTTDLLGDWTAERLAEAARTETWALAMTQAEATDAVRLRVDGAGAAARESVLALAPAYVRPFGGGRPGIPNGVLVPGPDGATEVWRLDRGRPAWRPFARYLSAGPVRAVTSVLPAGQWLQHGHGLEPGAQPYLFSHPWLRGAVAEVTESGLWIRPASGVPGPAAERPGRSVRDAHLVRGLKPRASGPVIAIGMPRTTVSPDELALAEYLLRHLRPDAVAGGQLILLARIGQDHIADLALVSRLAAAAGLADTTPRTVVGPRIRPAVPAFQAPAGLGLAGEIDEPGAVTGQETAFNHGITNPVLPARVVVNRHEIDAYLTIPVPEGRVAAAFFDEVVTGRLRAALPPEGADAWTTPRLPRANEIQLRLRIRPGAAILPAASSRPPESDNRAGLLPDFEIRLTLPLPTLARVRVIGAQSYGTDLAPVRRSAGPEFDLARIVLNAPGRGSAHVHIPWWAFTDDDIDEYLLAVGELIPAGYYFPPAGLTADAAADLLDTARQIPYRRGQTVLYFPLGPDGRPTPGGRRTSPELFTRVLRRLTVRHPELNQPVFVFAASYPGPEAAPDPGFAWQVAKLTQRLVIRASATVHLATRERPFRGLPPGTMVLPPPGRWYLATPGGLQWQDVTIDEPAIRTLAEDASRRAARAAGRSLLNAWAGATADARVLDRERLLGRFLRPAGEYRQAHPEARRPGESDVLMDQRVAAVIAEAYGRGRGVFDPPWQALARDGLARFPVYAGDLFYAGMPGPGIPGWLAAGTEFSAVFPVGVQARRPDTPVVFVIAGRGARDISGLTAGLGPDPETGRPPAQIMFGSRTRFRVTGVDTQTGFVFLEVLPQHEPGGAALDNDPRSDDNASPGPGLGGGRGVPPIEQHLRPGGRPLVLAGLGVSGPWSFADFVANFLAAVSAQQPGLGDTWRVAHPDLPVDRASWGGWLGGQVLPRPPLDYLLDAIDGLALLPGGQGLVARAAERAGLRTGEFREVLSGDPGHGGWDVLLGVGGSAAGQARRLIGALREPGRASGPLGQQMVQALLRADMTDGPGGLVTFVLPHMAASILGVRVRLQGRGQPPRVLGTAVLNAPVVDLALADRYAVHLPDRTFGATPLPPPATGSGSSAPPAIPSVQDALSLLTRRLYPPEQELHNDVRQILQALEGLARTEDETTGPLQPRWAEELVRSLYRELGLPEPRHVTDAQLRVLVSVAFPVTKRRRPVTIALLAGEVRTIARKIRKQGKNQWWASVESDEILAALRVIKVHNDVYPRRIRLGILDMRNLLQLADVARGYGRPGSGFQFFEADWLDDVARKVFRVQRSGDVLFSIEGREQSYRQALVASMRETFLGPVTTRSLRVRLDGIAKQISGADAYSGVTLAEYTAAIQALVLYERLLPHLGWEGRLEYPALRVLNLLGPLAESVRAFPPADAVDANRQQLAALRREMRGALSRNDYEPFKREYDRFMSPAIPVPAAPVTGPLAAAGGTLPVVTPGREPAKSWSVRGAAGFGNTALGPGNLLKALVGSWYMQRPDAVLGPLREVTGWDGLLLRVRAELVVLRRALEQRRLADTLGQAPDLLPALAGAVDAWFPGLVADVAVGQGRTAEAVRAELGQDLFSPIWDAVLAGSDQQDARDLVHRLRNRAEGTSGLGWDMVLAEALGQPADSGDRIIAHLLAAFLADPDRMGIRVVFGQWTDGIGFTVWHSAGADNLPPVYVSVSLDGYQAYDHGHDAEQVVRTLLADRPVADEGSRRSDDLPRYQHVVEFGDDHRRVVDFAPLDPARITDILPYAGLVQFTRDEIGIVALQIRPRSRFWTQSAPSDRELDDAEDVLLVNAALSPASARGVLAGTGEGRLKSLRRVMILVRGTRKYGKTAADRFQSDWLDLVIADVLGLRPGQITARDRQVLVDVLVPRAKVDGEKITLLGLAEAVKTWRAEQASPQPRWGITAPVDSPVDRLVGWQSWPVDDAERGGHAPFGLRNILLALLASWYAQVPKAGLGPIGETAGWTDLWESVLADLRALHGEMKLRRLAGTLDQADLLRALVSAVDASFPGLVDAVVGGAPRMIRAADLRNALRQDPFSDWWDKVLEGPDQREAIELVRRLRGQIREIGDPGWDMVLGEALGQPDSVDRFMAYLLADFLASRLKISVVFGRWLADGTFQRWHIARAGHNWQKIYVPVAASGYQAAGEPARWELLMDALRSPRYSVSGGVLLGEAGPVRYAQNVYELLADRIGPNAHAEAVLRSRDALYPESAGRLPHTASPDDPGDATLTALGWLMARIRETDDYGKTAGSVFELSWLDPLIADIPGRALGPVTASERKHLVQAVSQLIGEDHPAGQEITIDAVLARAAQNPSPPPARQDDGLDGGVDARRPSTTAAGVLDLEVVEFPLILPVGGRGKMPQTRVAELLERVQVLVNEAGGDGLVAGGRRIRVMVGAGEGGPPGSGPGEAEQAEPLEFFHGDDDQQLRSKVLQLLSRRNADQAAGDDYSAALLDLLARAVPPAVPTVGDGGPNLPLPGTDSPLARPGTARRAGAGPRGGRQLVRAGLGVSGLWSFADFVANFLEAVSAQQPGLGDTWRVAHPDLPVDPASWGGWLGGQVLPRPPLGYLLDAIDGLALLPGGQGLVARAAERAGLRAGEFRRVLSEDPGHGGWDVLLGVGGSAAGQARRLIGALREPGRAGGPLGQQMVQALLDADMTDGPGGLVTFVLPHMAASILGVRVRLQGRGQPPRVLGTAVLNAPVVDLALADRYAVHLPDRTFGATPLPPSATLAGAGGSGGVRDVGGPDEVLRDVVLVVRVPARGKVPEGVAGVLVGRAQALVDGVDVRVGGAGGGGRVRVVVRGGVAERGEMAEGLVLRPGDGEGELAGKVLYWAGEWGAGDGVRGGVRGAAGLGGGRAGGGAAGPAGGAGGGAGAGGAGGAGVLALRRLAKGGARVRKSGGGLRVVRAGAGVARVVVPVPVRGKASLLEVDRVLGRVRAWLREVNGRGVRAAGGRRVWVDVRAVEAARGEAGDRVLRPGDPDRVLAGKVLFWAGVAGGGVVGDLAGVAARRVAVRLARPVVPVVVPVPGVPGGARLVVPAAVLDVVLGRPEGLPAGVWGRVAEVVPGGWVTEVVVVVAVPGGWGPGWRGWLEEGTRRLADGVTGRGVRAGPGWVYLRVLVVSAGPGRGMVPAGWRRLRGSVPALPGPGVSAEGLAGSLGLGLVVPGDGADRGEGQLADVVAGVLAGRPGGGELPRVPFRVLGGHLDGPPAVAEGSGPLPGPLGQLVLGWRPAETFDPGVRAVEAAGLRAGLAMVAAVQAGLGEQEAGVHAGLIVQARQRPGLPAAGTGPRSGDQDQDQGQDQGGGGGGPSRPAGERDSEEGAGEAARLRAAVRQQLDDAGALEEAVSWLADADGLPDGLAQAYGEFTVAVGELRGGAPARVVERGAALSRVRQAAGALVRAARPVWAARLPAWRAAAPGRAVTAGRWLGSTGEQRDDLGARLRAAEQRVHDAAAGRGWWVEDWEEGSLQDPGAVARAVNEVVAALRGLDAAAAAVRAAVGANPDVLEDAWNAADPQTMAAVAWSVERGLEIIGDSDSELALREDFNRAAEALRVAVAQLSGRDGLAWAPENGPLTPARRAAMGGSAYSLITAVAAWWGAAVTIARMAVVLSVADRAQTRADAELLFAEAGSQAGTEASPETDRLRGAIALLRDATDSLEDGIAGLPEEAGPEQRRARVDAGLGPILEAAARLQDSVAAMSAIGLPPVAEDRAALLARLTEAFSDALPRYGCVPVRLTADRTEGGVARDARELMRELGYSVELAVVGGDGAAGSGNARESYLFDPLDGDVHDVRPEEDPGGEAHRDSVQAARDALQGPLVRGAAWPVMVVRGEGSGAGALLPQLGYGADRWQELTGRFGAVPGLLAARLREVQIRPAGASRRPDGGRRIWGAVSHRGLLDSRSRSAELGRSAAATFRDLEVVLAGAATARHHAAAVRQFTAPADQDLLGRRERTLAVALSLFLPPDEPPGVLLDDQLGLYAYASLPWIEDASAELIEAADAAAGRVDLPSGRRDLDEFAGQIAEAIARTAAAHRRLPAEVRLTAGPQDQAAAHQAVRSLQAQLEQQGINLQVSVVVNEGRANLSRPRAEPDPGEGGPVPGGAASSDVAEPDPAVGRLVSGDPDRGSEDLDSSADMDVDRSEGADKQEGGEAVRRAAVEGQPVPGGELMRQEASPAQEARRLRYEAVTAVAGRLAEGRWVPLAELEGLHPDARIILQDVTWAARQIPGYMDFQQQEHGPVRVGRAGNGNGRVSDLLQEARHRRQPEFTARLYGVLRDQGGFPLSADLAFRLIGRTWRSLDQADTALSLLAALPDTDVELHSDPGVFPPTYRYVGPGAVWPLAERRSGAGPVPAMYPGAGLVAQDDGREHSPTFLAARALLWAFHRQARLVAEGSSGADLLNAQTIADLVPNRETLLALTYWFAGRVMMLYASTPGSGVHRITTKSSTSYRFEWSASGEPSMPSDLAATRDILRANPHREFTASEVHRSGSGGSLQLQAIEHRLAVLAVVARYGVVEVSPGHYRVWGGAGPGAAGRARGAPGGWPGWGGGAVRPGGAACGGGGRRSGVATGSRERRLGLGRPGGGASAAAGPGPWLCHRGP